MKQPILIIGPSPEGIYFGGIHSHINNLKKLDIFQNAIVYDPGYKYSRNKVSIISIILRIKSLPKYIRDNNISCVLINSSISTYSIIKLSIILYFIRRNESTLVHVFFHGGRFERVGLFKYHHIINILKFAMLPTFYYHFLSTEQKIGFEKYYHGYNTALYRNYSSSNNIIMREHSKSNVLNLLFVGRLVKSKGIYEALNAVEYISKHMNGYIYLKYVGDGIEKNRLASTIRKKGLDNIAITGLLVGDALNNEYRNSDLLILPSYSEGFPYAMIEAFQAGLPIIGTPTGALADYIIDGITGFKVEQKNVLSLIKTISKCLNNRDMIKSMSDNCYKVFINDFAKIHAENYYKNITAIEFKKL
jgi:glycosyltransferase involved in cell wall biosynthesis